MLAADPSVVDPAGVEPSSATQPKVFPPAGYSCVRQIGLLRLNVSTQVADFSSTDEVSTSPDLALDRKFHRCYFAHCVGTSRHQASCEPPIAAAGAREIGIAGDTVRGTCMHYIPSDH